MDRTAAPDCPPDHTTRTVGAGDLDPGKKLSVSSHLLSSRPFVGRRRTPCARKDPVVDIDPSRGPRRGADGRRADGHDGPAVPRDFAGDDGWPAGADADVPSAGTRDGNRSAPDSRAGRSRTRPRSRANGNVVDRQGVAPAPPSRRRDGTGQRRPLMSSSSPLLLGRRRSVSVRNPGRA